MLLMPFHNRGFLLPYICSCVWKGLAELQYGATLSAGGRHRWEKILAVANPANQTRPTPCLPVNRGARAGDCGRRQSTTLQKAADPDPLQAVLQ